MASLTPPRPGREIGAPRTTPTRGGPALIKGTALRSTVSAIPRVAGEGGVARVAHATESSCQIDIRWSRLTNRPPCPDAGQGVSRDHAAR
jgi:hypothetical protein